MKIFKKITEKNNLLIIYKLLHNALLLVELIFVLAFVVDGLLPGLISDKISFSKIAALLILIIIAIVFLGQKLQITYRPQKINRNKFLPFLILLAFLLIGNSLLLFTLWQNIVITLITLLIFYLFYNLFFETEKN